MNTQLWESVSNALNGTPSQQPVGYRADVDKNGSDNDQKKVKQSIATGYKSKQKGNPNKSYSVSVIDKARARLG